MCWRLIFQLDSHIGRRYCQRNSLSQMASSKDSLDNSLPLYRGIRGPPNTPPCREKCGGPH